MSLLSPAALFLAVLLPVIVAMYLLKLRRTDHVVSSTYLWRQIVRDLEANAPWQRLRRNLLLLLQLLFLSVLIFAIARPFTWSKGVTGQALIVIIDSSASMVSTDVSPNRMEAAKNQAIQLVDQLPDGARITIIDAGRKARVVAASSSDHQQVRRAISEITVGASGSDMGIALQLASAIAMRQPGAQTVVLSDGNISLPDRISLSGSVSFRPIGVSPDNQGIELLTLQTMPGSGNLSAFAQVFNYSKSPVLRRIAIYRDGRLANVYDLDLPSNGQQSVVMEDLPGETNVVEARLLPDEQVIDYLISDDNALIVNRKTDPISVTLVTQGNLFLETALAIFPGLKITSINPDSVQNYPTADLTILDRYVPDDSEMPPGNIFFIAPPKSTPFFTNNGIIERPVPVAADNESETLALIENVNLDDVNILDAVRIPLPTWAEAEIVCEDLTQGEGAISPLLFTGETGGRRLAVMAIDLTRSDLPLQVAFPILLANLVNWLAPGQGSDIPIQVKPGEAMAFSIPPGSANQDQPRVTVTRPDGTSMQISVESNQVVFADTDELGLYRVDLGENQTFAFAVNLFSPQESSIEPVGSLPALEAAATEQEESYQRARREWWRVGAALALLILIIEWLVYNRSTIAMLYRWLSLSFKKTFSAKS